MERVPWVGLVSPATTRRRVDLPAPFSPRMTTLEPAGILSETLRSAANAPYTRETRVSSTAGVRLAAADIGCYASIEPRKICGFLCHLVAVEVLSWADMVGIAAFVRG